MTYERATARYRRWYSTLLRFYPKQYRERFAEGMKQTFNDLCREQYKAEGKLFGFVFWTFADTVAAIIKENIEKENTIMIPILKKHGAAIIYLITAVAIIATAYLLKGTEYENIWLYILGVGIILASAFEVYSRTKDKDKH